jgi:serine protease Do
VLWLDKVGVLPKTRRHMLVGTALPAPTTGAQRRCHSLGPYEEINMADMTEQQPQDSQQPQQQQQPQQAQQPQQPPQAPQVLAQPPVRTALSDLSDQLADAVQRASRSLVTVAARPRQPATGILWREGQETVILTADHVIEREDDINVVLPGGQQVKAQLAGRDTSTDIAVLRLPDGAIGPDAAPAEQGAALRVGHLVLAVGRPDSDGPRVSFGAVSFIDGPQRTWQGGELEGIIFADVTLYPGFSGGPLIDLAGRVVGMSSSHLTRQQNNAVPLATLRRVSSTLLTHGRVRRGYLGIGAQPVPLSSTLAQKAGASQDTALLLVTVEEGSPAERAGLLIGDILVSLGGQPVTDVESLRKQLGATSLDQPVQAKVLRGGEPRDVAVTLADRK